MAKEKEPIRIAQIMGYMNGAGVEAVVTNYYKYIDKSKIQFDFICCDGSTNIPYEEIEKQGGRVIMIPPYKKMFSYQKELKKVLKNNSYKIVHSHVNALSVFSLFAAKRAGVSIRIAHSHSSSNKKEKTRNVVKNVLKLFSKLFATDYMACSEHAARWLFGNKAYESGKVYILNNAIDIENFTYNEAIRKKIRKKYNISKNTIVIGHVGRFVTQKNHEKIINIFNELLKMKDNCVLLLIGQGPLESKIISMAKDYSISDKVIFAGQQNNIYDYYQAMDLFLFPSLYEGLGMVTIEAQVSGLPCICSDVVPNEVNITNLVEFVNLNKSDKEWALIVYNKIISQHDRIDYYDDISNDGYNIKEEVLKLEKKYNEYQELNNSIAIITSGFLPVPATKGGAVENLIDIVIRNNEKYGKLNLVVFSIYNEESQKKSQSLKNTKLIFINNNVLCRFLDRIVFFIFDKLLKKKNSFSYRYIFQRLYFFRKCSNNLKHNNYGKVLLENHPSMYFVMKYHKNYNKYKERYYYHCHNDLPSFYGMKNIIDKTSRFICVSNFRKKYLIKRLGYVDETKIDVLYNCCDNDIKRSITRSEFNLLKTKFGIKSEKIILFIGRVVDDKGVLELVSACKKLRYSNYKLIIVGASIGSCGIITDYEKKVENEIESINDKVIFTGFVNHSELYKYYDIANVVIIPSQFEDSAPLVLIEALTKGKAIIASNSGGIPEYSKETSTILINRGDSFVEELKNNLEVLLQDEKKIKKMQCESIKKSKEYSEIKYYKNFCDLMK